MTVMYMMMRCDSIGNQSFDDGLGSSRGVGRINKAKQDIIRRKAASSGGPERRTTELRMPTQRTEAGNVSIKDMETD